MRTEISGRVPEDTDDASGLTASVFQDLPDSTLLAEYHFCKGFVEYTCPGYVKLPGRSFHPFHREDGEERGIHAGHWDGDGGFPVSFFVQDISSQWLPCADGFYIRAGIPGPFDERPADMSAEKPLIHPVVFQAEHLLVSFKIGIKSRIPTHLHHQDHGCGKSHAHSQYVN